MWWEIKDHLEIKENKLYFANLLAEEIANKFGTPLYVYNSKRVVENYRRFKETFKKYADREIRIYYSMKANSNPEILKLLKEENSYVDCVSPEEVNLAIKVGFEEDKIIFTGSSVSLEDLIKIKKYKIKINIDSFSQFKKILKLKIKNDISFRVDPGLKGLGQNWKTITAGKKIHGIPIKFSIPKNNIIKIIKIAKNSKLKVAGLHEHVGSNWIKEEEIKEFFETVKIILKIAEKATNILGYKLDFLSFGGGAGIRYHKNQKDFPLEKYAKETCKIIKDHGLDFNAICFEPGRYIVADSGILLVKVTDVKKRYGKIIVGVNSGFNHLIRPVLYNAYHEIINCNNVYGKKEKVTIVGNLCETGDVFAIERKISIPKEGDILAILNTGAYGYVMASRYNLRELPKEIIIFNRKAILFKDKTIKENKTIEIKNL